MLTVEMITKRMGQIDDAFPSRIQVALGYSKLRNDAQMSIWKGFFEQVEDRTEQHRHFPTSKGICSHRREVQKDRLE
jgi:hypothetical protein